MEHTKIPNEIVTEQAVPVLEEHRIPDLVEALLEQERAGALHIRRYHTLTQKDLTWIRHAEAEEIRKRGLLDADTPMARWMKDHYPESWALAASLNVRHP